MALTFEDITVDTRTISAIEIGTDTDNYILEDSLSWFDKEQLELALAETSLADYTMPNTGITADAYFAPFIHSLEDLTKRYQYSRIKSRPVKSIADLETAVAAIPEPTP